MAHMPHNQLLDMLFALIGEQEQWSIKLPREKTQQPEVYLREVLSEMARLCTAVASSMACGSELVPSSLYE